MYDYDKQDPHFVDDLRNSQPAVEKAAGWLAGLGYAVNIPEMRVRPDSYQISQWADSGDIHIVQSVEVKQRVDMTFMDRSEFRYETIIVDTCRAFDRKRPKPYVYIIGNSDMTAAFIVNVPLTQRKWTRVEKYNNKLNRVTEFYECPVEILEFVRIGA